jgi:DNA-binding GntR family transcriptional regulator
MLVVSERNEKESARDYAYRVIRSNILELYIMPGTAVSEKSLCDELHISRTPVREALLDLSRQKLVDIIPQKGTTISLIDPKMVQEGHFLRTIVEKEVVALASSTINETWFHTLESNVMMQEYHATHNSVDEFIQLDNEFHKTLFRMCDKEATYSIVTDFQSHFDRERKLSLHYVSMSDLAKDHRKVLDAIQDGDALKAQQAMNSHLGHVLIDQSILMEKFPSYFKHP